jgi:hypothetical protein
MKSLTMLLVAGLLLTGTVAFAQPPVSRVINATGGAYVKGYYRLDWSVGELALVNEMQSSSAKYIITNGFLQTLTNVPDSNNSSKRFDPDEVIILPNPTRDWLQINFRTKQTGQVELRLYDIPGKVLYSTRFNIYNYEYIERINLSGIANGTYMLSVEMVSTTGGGHKKGSYKIIKVN